MANEVAKANSGGALAAVNALKSNLQKVKATLPEARGKGFMSFGKDGIWTFGQDNEEVFPDDKIAINPFSIETGFICWSDRGDGGPKNEVLGEVMVPLGGDVPLAHTLPVKEDAKSVKTPEWKDQISVQMRFMDGPHEGKQVKYSATSLGGIDALRGLIDQIMLQLDEDGTKIVPVVSLDSDHYMHKKWGKTYVPLLKITDFISLDEQPDVVEESDGEEQEEEKPKARERSKPADKPARTRKAAEPEESEEQTEEAQDEAPAETRSRTRTRRR